VILTLFPFTLKFNAILCLHVSFLVLLVFALPTRGQGALSTGLVRVYSDNHADKLRETALGGLTTGRSLVASLLDNRYFIVGVPR
jgi:hypothetical protein